MTATQETVVRIQAYSLSEYEQLEGPPFPGGDLDFEVPFQIGMPGALSATYVGTRGRTTRPDDTPPNQVILGGFNGRLNYAITLFGGIDPSTGGRVGTEGSLALGPAPELQALLGRLIDGAGVDIFRGPQGRPLSSFETAARLTAAGLMIDSQGKDLALRDRGWLLSTALHDLRYAGTGGLEGPTELANVWRPYAVGYVEKVPPVLMDPPRQIYQVSCGRIQTVTAVQIGGAEVTPSEVDYPTYDALAAAVDAEDIAEGTFATCLAYGLFALGGAATRQVTATVEGDAEVIDGLGYASTRAAIARRIATGRGAERFAAADLDLASFAALDAAFPERCGWYWDSEITKEAALDEIMRGVLGLWFVTMQGKLTLWWLREPPPAEEADYELIRRSGDLRGGDADIIGQPVMVTRATGPRRRTDLGYAKNYAVQTQDQLAGALAGTTAALAWGLPQQTVSEAATWISRVAPTAPAVVVETGYPDEASALAECRRAQALLGVQRTPWKMRTSFPDGTDVVGKSIAIRGFADLGLDGRVAWCIGAEPESGLLTLTLWS